MSHRPTAPLAGIISVTPQEGGLPAVVLPVNPPREEIDAGFAYHSQGLLSGYDIGRRGNNRLTRLTFDSFFPADLTQPWVNPGLPYEATPEEYVRLFDQIVWHKVICFVSIPGLAFQKEMVLTDFTSSLEGGNGEATDVQYSMTWSEYVRLNLRADPRRSVRPAAPGTGGGGQHTVVSGDTLWGIAKSTYGDGSLWTIIWDANKPMTSGNPDLIYPGEVLYLPKR